MPSLVLSRDPAQGQVRNRGVAYSTGISFPANRWNFALLNPSIGMGFNCLLFASMQPLRTNSGAHILDRRPSILGPANW